MTDRQVKTRELRKSKTVMAPIQFSTRAGTDPSRKRAAADAEVRSPEHTQAAGRPRAEARAIVEAIKRPSKDPARSRRSATASTAGQ